MYPTFPPFFSEKLLMQKCVAYNQDVILGVVINETCYKMGHVRTRDFTVVFLHFRNGSSKSA